jgi:hypothetical protein
VDSFDNDHERLPMPLAHTPANVSRRTFFGVAGAVGIAGAAIPALSASAATVTRRLPASPAASSHIAGFAGANKTAFASMLDGTPKTPPTGVRWYLDEVTYPNTEGYAKVRWPKITATYHSPAHALVSIRPEVEMLINGAFDAQLYAFMQSAPEGPTSLLTMWHECATFTLQKNSRYPKKPALFREGLAHLQRLARGEIKGYPNPSNVKVGVIDINPSYLENYPGHKGDPGAVYAEWMIANLDWYGCDLYDNRMLNLSVYDELNAFRDYINKLPGSTPGADWPVNLPECNSRIVDKKKGISTKKTTGPTGYRRSDFFHYAWAWLQNVGPGGHASGLLGFWGGTGGEGSPWPPADNPHGSLAAMVAELNAEYKQSAP